MKLSIIIPTYNRANFLNEAFESVKNQKNFDFNDLEFVIVNDSSIDNTDEIVNKWSNFFDIKYIKQDKKTGVCISRNIAIKNAKYEIIVFFDDDALMQDDCLYNISNIMESEKAVVGKVMAKTDNVWKYFTGHYNQGDEVCESNSFLETIAAFNKEVFENVGYLNENIDYGSEGEEYYRRLENSQYKLMYYPNIVIFHDYSNGIFKFIKKQYKFGEKMLYVKQVRVKSVLDCIKQYRSIKKGRDNSDKNIFKTNSLFKDIKFSDKIFFIILSKIGVIAHLIGTIKGFYKYDMKIKN